MTDLTDARACATSASHAPDAGCAISWLTVTCKQILAHLEAQQTSPQPATAPPAAQQGDSGHRDGGEAVRAAEDYTPQAWRLTGYYPESYARLMDILNVGILPDWDDDDRNRHEAEFRADLAARDAEVAAKALRDAADALDALTPETIPSDPRWTCDLGYYGEAEWLRDRADRLEGR